ncbi:alpha/beta hydrolase [Glycomyces tenuis]|uniref:alpha/beta hydrolase n=1 Tax=Glycomyces tenuis TaxID=58116 RepID=UPI0004171379|nr:alpha/beta hydrolase [Glycomyces tenuis]
MSDLTWKDLRDLDCAAVRDIGERWKTYVAEMAEQSERLRGDVVDGHLSAADYESDTADQIREHIGLFAGRFEDDLADYADIRLATTLLETADALEAEQKELNEVVGLIEEHDFEIEGGPREYEVNPTGHLHRAIWLHLDPPQWLCDRAGVGKPSAWYDLLSEAEVLGNLNDIYNAANELCGQYQDWLRAVMSRAHDADDDAAAALAAMRENPSELPPQLGATYDELIDDYKSELSEEVAAEMEAIANGDSDMSPEQVNRWWENLSDAEREALIAEHPEWVGPTDGIPVEARDTANRTVLDDRISELDMQIASIEAQLETLNGDPNAAGMYGQSGADPDELRAELEELREDRDGLAALQDRITDDNGEPAITDKTGQPYYLMDFGTEGSGQAVVSIGNPDTAQNVNAYVPGTTADLQGAAGGLMNRTETMARDAQYLAPGEETATILWMGYDAPDTVFPEATQTEWAEGAADDLESFTQGIRATAEGDPSNLTLTGHSYGTTVIGEAAATEGVDADNLIFVASPGVIVSTADALGVDGENVYASTNSLDPISLTPDFLLGENPTEGVFGGSTFHSDHGAWNANNHSTYWDDTNTAGRDSMAKIVTGAGG